MTELIIPKANFHFGQRVRIDWQDAGIESTEETITGINYDHRRDTEILYTTTDSEGSQTDYLDESMLTPLPDKL